MGIRKAVLSDMTKIARIHKEQFKDHFLGQYSQKVVQKYYEPFLDSCIFLVSESQGKINGFIMGGLNSDLEIAKRSFLFSNKARYITETLIKPTVYIQALKRLNLLKVLKSSPSVLKETVAVEYRLLSIAVSESTKGTGLSSKLLTEFEKHIKAKDYGLSVHTHNLRAMKFYLKNGFVKTHNTEVSTFLSKNFVTDNKKQATV